MSLGIVKESALWRRRSGSRGFAEERPRVDVLFEEDVKEDRYEATKDSDESWVEETSPFAKLGGRATRSEPRYCS